LTVILFFGVIIFLRKLHWDAIQLNLLQLEDDIGGNVIRKGFLTRPLYHGRYNSIDLTINFSTEKFKKSRRNYIDISIGKQFKYPFTLSSLNWLQERGESTSDYEPIKATAQNDYGLRKETKGQVIKKNRKSDFTACISKLDPMNFIYFSKNGLLFERECRNLADETKYHKLKATIDTLYELLVVVE
jgi:hypothetical protein